MQTTPAALSLIKAWEGFKPLAYLDSAGIPTIGIGTIRYKDGESVQIGDEITLDDAEEELFWHVRRDVEPALATHFGHVPLQPNQRDALASFIYNLGSNENTWPTLKRKIIEHQSDAVIADQWMKYHRVGKRPNKGLYRRRMAEVLFWMGWAWEAATEAVQTVELGDDWRDIVTANELSADLFEDPDLAMPGDARDQVILKPKPKPITEEAEPVTTLPTEVPDVPVKMPTELSKLPGEVPYGITRETAKPMEQSQRFIGSAMILFGTIFRRLSTFGIGTSGAVGVFGSMYLDILANPAAFSLVLFAGAWVVFWITQKLGKKVKQDGEVKASELLY